MESAPLHLAFIWHMHQPMYRKPETHEYMMPWVRLHATKDYLDMLHMVQRYPRLKHTFNFVPSLIEQLQDYATGQATDRYLTLTLKPVAELSRADQQEILESFFDLNHQQMIFPYPRYKELLEKKQRGETYTPQDFIDLTLWFNLSWTDPLHRETYPQLQEWITQGSGFSEKDRETLIQIQQNIMADPLPAYRKALASQQIELTTTPYYHPILPLLSDTQNAVSSRSDSTTPQQRLQAPEDTKYHLQKAKAYHQQMFGQTPVGLWPSEQSMSPDLIETVAEQGFQWLASSEGILWHSLDTWAHRENGIHPDVDKLCRPYRVEINAEKHVTMVFRDIYLSDWLGFNAWKGDNVQQAHAFYQEIKKIQQRLRDISDFPYLLTIALDGENCWEYYQQDGKIFLETLYQLLNDDRSIHSTSVSDYLQKHPATDTLPRLHPGSWINSDFSTWIGEPTKNKAWDLLITTRQELVKHDHLLNTEDRKKAWEMLYTAEGSDWFWWFGAGHSSRHDAHFDAAFRTYLTAVYRLLRLEVPAALQKPLEPHDEAATLPLSTMQASQEGY